MRPTDADNLLKDLGEEPYIWTDTDAEIQAHSDWLRFKEMIEAQPTINVVEVPHGRWDDKGYCTNCGGRCIGCGCAEWKTKYCPHCGAKMR